MLANSTHKTKVTINQNNNKEVIVDTGNGNAIHNVQIVDLVAVNHRGADFVITINHVHFT